MKFQIRIPADLILVVMAGFVRKLAEDLPATALWDSKEQLARVRKTLLGSYQLNMFC